MNRIVGPEPRSRLPKRSGATGLVAFLFGVAGRPALPGVLLTELLSEFGISEDAARQQLARMRLAGQIRSTRSGRGATYRLAGQFAASAVRLRLVEEGTPPPWDGHFHALLYQIPESQRAYRDRLRRTAVFLGYGVLQPGVLIGVHDRIDELKPVLASRPGESLVRQVTVGMNTAEAAQAAVTAWELPEVARNLGAHVETLRRALRTPKSPPPTAATLHRLAGLLNRPFIDLMDDPGLPGELQPPKWPARELRAIMVQVQHRYLPPASRYLHQRLAATIGEVERP